MSGALDSGMDLLFEISSGFIRRVVRRKLRALDQGCFTATQVPVPNPLDPDHDILLDVRRVQLDVADVSFSQVINGPAFMTLELELLYGQAFWDNAWKSLDELEEEFRQANVQLHSFRTPPLQLSASAEADQIVLAVDTAELEYLPEDLRDLLGDSISIPISFLNQTETYIDEAGAEQTATLLALTINGEPMLRALSASSLVIGLDVELAQDDHLRILGPGVSDSVPIGPGDLVPHECGLPAQPFVDRLTFTVDFADSFAGGHDWALALDAHILDAILRGESSAGLNNAGEETADCEHDKATQSMCIRLDPPLEDDIIHISGQGAAYICTPDWLFFIANDYYWVEFSADVTLTVQGAWVRARYEVTNFTVRDLRAWGPDLTDLALSLADEDQPEGDELRAFPSSFGERTDPAGRLTVDQVQVRSNGLVLRGSSSVAPPNRGIAAPEEVLFSFGCQRPDEPSTRRIALRNTGDINLHLCPVGFRAHPDGSPADVGLFSITAPEELLDEGEGLTLTPGERVLLDVACAGDAGGVYIAWLDIPNDAQMLSIRLNANFQPVALGPVVDEVDFGAVHYGWAGCNRPGDQFVSRDLEIVNEGPGTMQLCTIHFSRDVEAVFTASNPGIFAPGTRQMHVTFNAPWGVDDDYDGTLRIVTNRAERRDIRVVASVRTEQDPFGVFNHAGFDRDFACGDADWDRIQDTHGRILDYHDVAELLPILGGEPCCPPPRGPACLCVDMWETAFFDVPSGVDLEVVNPAGQAIAHSVSHAGTLVLVTPIEEKAAYALRANLPAGFPSAHSSRMSTRRWIAQQDGFHEAGQTLADVSVVGDYAYAIGDRALEVISLQNARRPKRVRFARSLAGTCVAGFGSHLIVVADELGAYSLENPLKPRLASSLGLKERVHTVLARPDPTPLAYALGKRLHVLDLSDPKRVRVAKSRALRVRANRAWQRGDFLYALGKNGIDVLDVTAPLSPKRAGFLATQREVKNGFVSGKSVVLINDADAVEIVDISDPSRPQLSGRLQLEEWAREFTPIAGSFPRHGNRFLVLTPDQRGIRVMRMRRNKVDQSKLTRWRAERRTSTPRYVGPATSAI